jgi:hypothetical protein
MDSPDARNASFDRAARARYANALEHLSPAVRVRLQQARHAATPAAPGPKRHRIGWAWAGSAAVLSLIVGLQLRHAPIDLPPATPLAAVPADNHPVNKQAAIDHEVASMLAALDENPDFYLWLAANDSALPPPSEQ